MTGAAGWTGPVTDVTVVADLDRIFQRFARANPQRSSETGGFGLGLAIVQAVATAHHGSVQVQSTPGRGSSTAPTAASPPEQATAPSGSAGLTRGRAELLNGAGNIEVGISAGTAARVDASSERGSVRNSVRPP